MVKKKKKPVSNVQKRALKKAEIREKQSELEFEEEVSEEKHQLEPETKKVKVDDSKYVEYIDIKDNLDEAIDKAQITYDWKEKGYVRIKH